MSVGTLSESLDNLYTTTWQHMKDTVRDQIFDSSPFWFWLKDKGKLKSVSGGRFLTDPLQYAKNDNVSWIGKGGVVPLNDYEFLTIAQYDWKYQATSMVRFGIDDQQNRGKQQIINLMNSKMDNSKNSIISDLESKLFASAASGNEIDGLQHLVADDPTADVAIGGVNQSTYSWWRNQEKDMTGLSFATNGITEMRTMLNNTANNLLGIAAGIYYLPHSTFAAAGFFLLADIIAKRRGEMGDKFEVGTAIAYQRLFGVLFFTMAVLIVGLPPLSGFIGKFLILNAAISHPSFFLIMGVVLVSSFMGLVAVARSGSLMFYRALPAKQIIQTSVGLLAKELMPVISLLLLCIILVVCAGPIMEFSIATADQLLQPATYIDAALSGGVIR